MAIANLFFRVCGIMVVMILVYLGRQFVFRVTEFLRHWYFGGYRVYVGFWMRLLEDLDYTFAWRLTFLHLFQPMYGDYTFVGRILGPFFRLGRLLVASVLYVVIFVVAGVGYVVWALVPIYLVARFLVG